MGEQAGVDRGAEWRRALVQARRVAKQDPTVGANVTRLARIAGVGREAILAMIADRVMLARDLAGMGWGDAWVWAWAHLAEDEAACRALLTEGEP